MAENFPLELTFVQLGMLTNRTGRKITRYKVVTTRESAHAQTPEDTNMKLFSSEVIEARLQCVVICTSYAMTDCYAEISSCKLATCKLMLQLAMHCDCTCKQSRVRYTPESAFHCLSFMIGKSYYFHNQTL